MNTVLVTGATDGLGRALAARLAGEGNTVLAHARSEERGRKALESARLLRKLKPLRSLPRDPPPNLAMIFFESLAQIVQQQRQVQRGLVL